MSDLLNFLKEKDEMYLTGNYYSKRPKTTQDACEQFNYCEATPKDMRSTTVANSLHTQQNSLTIKTNDQLKWKDKGYVVTQDGNLWQIEGIATKKQIEGKEQALRLFATPCFTEYTLTLIQVDNAEGLR